jgi:hypothetical protein
MNALNALTFAVLGATMEVLPVLFPSWFPRHSADQASTRALWLSFMGATQVAIGVGYMVLAYALPVFARLASSVPASGQNALPLPAARSMSGR